MMRFLRVLFLTQIMLGRKQPIRAREKMQGFDPYRIGTPFVFSQIKDSRKYTQGLQILSQKQSRLLSPHPK
jgi:hypothetical protein